MPAVPTEIAEECLPIERMGEPHPLRQKRKHPAWGVSFLAGHFIPYPNPDSYLSVVYSAVCSRRTDFPLLFQFDWMHVLWYDHLTYKGTLTFDITLCLLVNGSANLNLGMVNRNA